ncbi:MAG: RNA polymerase sigma factor [Pirellulaceae bacterium]|nr:RNA polymerase sigma factor [Planctomycetales bacterium]
MNHSTPQPGNQDLPTLSSMLLGHVQAMDPAAWSRLVNTFGPVVYRWCRASGIDEHQAADVVQDVFVSVARGIGQFQRQKEVGSFRAWLATITRSRVRDHFRRAAKTQAAAGGSDAMDRINQLAEQVDSTICVDNIGHGMLRSVTDRVRSEFRDEVWKAFYMVAIDGRSAADTATELGMSVANVYQSKSRVLRRLRQSMAELPQ